jgi:transposase
MDVLHDRCAGLDIGKKDLKACVRTPSPTGRRSRRQEIRTFATTTNALLELRDWLLNQQVTLVVMEATGDYWRGAYYLLEDTLNVMLVNAAHAKGLPGRKTDLLTELPVRSLALGVRLPIGVATFPVRDQRRGWVAGVVQFGGSTARVA